MWRKILGVVILLFFVDFFSCSSGIKLQFHQPVGKPLIGIRKLVIAPGEGSNDVALVCSYLTSRLKQHDYFLLFDSNKFSLSLEQNQLTYENVKQLDSLSRIVKLEGVDGIIFSELKSLEIPPDEPGIEQVKKSVWTGEYERDQNGQIIEELSPTGEAIKKKKFKLQTVDQHFKIRNARLIVSFQLIDLKKGSVIFSQELTTNYTSGKIIKEEEQPVPTDNDIKRLLAQNVVDELLGKIEPRSIIVKRPLEKGIALIDSGAVHAQAGRWSQAQQVWHEAEELFPTDARIYYNLGLAAEAQGDYKAAEIYYKKAALLNPGKKLYQKAMNNIRKVWQKK
jgi:hypothetical protein